MLLGWADVSAEAVGGLIVTSGIPLTPINTARTTTSLIISNGRWEKTVTTSVEERRRGNDCPVRVELCKEEEEAERRDCPDPAVFLQQSVSKQTAPLYLLCSQAAGVINQKAWRWAAVCHLNLGEEDFDFARLNMFLPNISLPKEKLKKCLKLGGLHFTFCEQ